MIDFKLAVGKVTNTEHDPIDGGIQIKLLPDHEDVSDDMLPWAYPFFGGYASATNVTYDSHKVGDMLWILYEDDGRFDPCYFIPFFSLPQSFNYDALTSRLENVTDIEDYEYGSIFIKLHDNGDIVFRNKVNKDSVLLKDVNTYVYFKGTGEIEVFTPEKEVKVHNGKAEMLMAGTGDVSITNENATVEIANAGEITLNGGTAKVGRVDDAVKSTTVEDSAYWTWLTSFTAVFNAWTPVPSDGGAVLAVAMKAFLLATPAPSSLTGKITAGADKVLA